MAKIRTAFCLNARAMIWLHFLANQTHHKSTMSYVEAVLLRHLEQTPGVDLSRSPYSEPKGVSDGKKG